jgi:hypothetical protein
MTGRPIHEATHIIVGNTLNDLRVTRVYSFAQTVNNGIQRPGPVIGCFICVFAHEDRQDFLQMRDIIGFTQLIGNLQRESARLRSHFRRRRFAAYLVRCNPEVVAVQIQQEHVDLEGRSLPMPSPVAMPL